MTVTRLAGSRYRIEGQLGAGGMATVYLARDTELDRPVAIKVLADNLSAETEIRERFLREGRLAGRLSHPNVVAVFDAGEEDGRPYIVMEHVEGETLADALPRLQATYCGTIAYEVEHISDHEQRVWLRQAIESGRYRQPLDADEKKLLLERLTEVEALEHYLRRTFLGQKQSRSRAST